MLSSDFETGTGKTLKHEDLGKEEWELTIKGMTKYEFDQTNRETGEHYKEWKPIFSFEEIEQTFVCNKSNRRVLTADWGNDMLSWIGKTVILYVGKWPSGDLGIMARVPKRAVKPGKPSRESENPAADLDDEIPF
jgi:hypothetical protein